MSFKTPTMSPDLNLYDSQDRIEVVGINLVYKWVNSAQIFFDTNYFQLLMGLRRFQKSEF